MNSSNLLFLFLIFFSPLISMSASDWVLSWIGMELGMIGLFPLLLLSLSSSSKESMMKYFLVQSLASAIMFISGIVYFHFFELFSICVYFFMMSLSLKLGFFPGHFWVSNVVNSLSWISNLLILGPLKIAPFGFLSFLVLNSDGSVYLLLMLGSLSALIGSFLGNNQTSIRSMLGSSSISHSGWMCVSMCFGYLWGYLFSYLLILSLLFLSLFSLDYFSSSIMMLSLSGLPPFLMFVMKMKVLLYSFLSLEYLVFVILILSSVISLNFYLKFFYSFILMNNIKKVFIMMVFCIINILGIFFLL
uniref:NADH-ubiquinone oxidoreductase chain 2 n=1 Tax=Planorbella pilsbryi TaxID=2823525 RepID=A0A8E8U4F1_9GAST|nr:NADH dehydrogenase subunit 2 [Planorbella pilsbryi]